MPDGYPCVFADLPGPEGSPTVLLYAHYDVQPAPKSQGWSTEPFEPVTREDGRIYGRGAADDKSGLVIHYATLRLLGPDRPCRIKLLVEGEEETISHLEDFVEANPERFAADAYVIADIGGQVVGRPGLTTALRGDVACTLTVRTLAYPVHSGLFGGAAPDAMTAMIRILDTLHDENGDTVIPGVDSSTWDGRRDGGVGVPGGLGDPPRRRLPRHRLAVGPHLGEALGHRARDGPPEHGGGIQRAAAGGHREALDADRARLRCGCPARGAHGAPPRRSGRGTARSR